MDIINPAVPGEQKFKGQILQNIYRVWLFRTFAPVLVAEVILLAAVLYTLGRTVFVERILGNFFKVLFADPAGIPTFLVGAFSHSSWTARATAIAAAVALAFIIRHVTQGILRFILVKKNYFSRVNAPGNAGN